MMEIGPIRPPSQAASLLVRVTRNCPWNRCAFCPVYKGEEPSARPAAEVTAELAWAAGEARRLLGAAGREAPPLPREAARAALAGCRVGAGGEALAHLVVWLLHGGEGAFLQDADPLRAGEAAVGPVLAALREGFPWLREVTAYARTSTLKLLGREALARLGAAGLARVHCGVESGSDEVLRRMRKGATFSVHRDGIAAAREAGLQVCAYVMPGLGGRELSAVHAAETARLLREARPDTVRLRTTFVVPGTPLAELAAAGTFTPLAEAGVVAEIAALLAAAGPLPLELFSDHSLNLFPELQGRLDRDLPAMLAGLAGFLALPEADREAVIRERRQGLPRLI